jgi:hypothetical protein
MKKILLILAAAISSVALPSCIFHGSNGETVAVIPVGHVHSDSCGHYTDRGNWRYQEHHTHSSTCGHVLVSGTWSVRN